MTSPKNSPRALLDEKREDLRAAEAQLTAAESTMDVDATMAAQQRITVLKQFITRLEAESATELEAEGQARAQAWLATLPKQSAARAKAIAAAQREAQRLLGEALAAIQEEAKLRREAAKVASGVRVLSARFPGLVPPKWKEPPPVLDHAFDLVTAANNLLTVTKAATVRLTPVVTESMGPEQRRQAVLRAVAELVSRRRSAVPPDVAEILDAAPIPTAALGLKPDPVPSAHEQRAAAAMREAVRIANVEGALLNGGGNRLGRGM